MDFGVQLANPGSGWLCNFRRVVFDSTHDAPNRTANASAKLTAKSKRNNACSRFGRELSPQVAPAPVFQF